MLEELEGTGGVNAGGVCRCSTFPLPDLRFEDGRKLLSGPDRSENSSFPIPCSNSGDDDCPWGGSNNTFRLWRYGWACGALCEDGCGVRSGGSAFACCFCCGWSPVG